MVPGPQETGRGAAVGAGVGQKVGKAAAVPTISDVRITFIVLFLLDYSLCLMCFCFVLWSIYSRSHIFGFFGFSKHFWSKFHHDTVMSSL